jgi:hypothetical protein
MAFEAFERYPIARITKSDAQAVPILGCSIMFETIL